MTTSPPISTADRDKAKELCAKATPGPWLVKPLEYDDWGTIRVAGNAYVANARAGGLISEADFNEHRRQGTDPYQHNADFIAFARTAIPSFEARVVELEAANEKLRFDLRLIREQQKADFARATALLEALTHIIREESEHGYTVEARMHAMARYAKSAIAAQQDRQTEG